MFEWIDDKIGLMKWYDISLIKLSTFAFALLLAKFWDPILSLEWYWYLIVMIAASVRPLMIIFQKE